MRNFILLTVICVFISTLTSCAQLSTAADAVGTEAVKLLDYGKVYIETHCTFVDDGNRIEASCLRKLDPDPQPKPGPKVKPKGEIDKLEDEAEHLKDEIDSAVKATL